MKHVYQSALAGVAAIAVLAPMLEGRTNESLYGIAPIAHADALALPEKLSPPNETVINVGAFALDSAITTTEPTIVHAERTHLLDLNIKLDPVGPNNSLQLPKLLSAEEAVVNLEIAKDKKEAERRQRNETIVSAVNDTIDPERIYQIDPTKIREALLFLLDDGFTIQGASALVGAIMTESRINPNEGGGIIQWQGNRPYFDQKISVHDSLAYQLQVLINEMHAYNKYELIYLQLHDPNTSLKQANQAVQRYIRAGVLGKRAEYAKTLSELLLAKQETLGN